MSFEEYKSRIIEILKNKLKDNAYINKLDKDIWRSYEEAKEVSKLLGSSQISADGYALGIIMMYPNLP